MSASIPFHTHFPGSNHVPLHDSS